MGTLLGLRGRVRLRSLILLLLLSTPAWADAPPVVIVRGPSGARRLVGQGTPLASGPHHEVWKAKDAQTGQSVALRLIRKDAMDAGHADDIDEHVAARAVSHPHLLKATGIAAVEGQSDRSALVYELAGGEAIPNASPHPLPLAIRRVADSIRARLVADEAYNGVDDPAEAKNSARAMAFLLTGVHAERYADVATRLPQNVRPAGQAPGTHSLHQVLERAMAGGYPSAKAFLEAIVPFSDGATLTPERVFWVKPYIRNGGPGEPRHVPITYKLEADNEGWVKNYFVRPGLSAWVHFNVHNHTLLVTQGESRQGPGLQARDDAAVKQWAKDTIFPGSKYDYTRLGRANYPGSITRE
jgi:hypothetical protein